jgi:ankyrin repeat protein
MFQNTRTHTSCTSFCISALGSMKAQPLLHPLDESNAAFRAVTALFEQWTTLGERLPDVPPLVPMVLHALLSNDDALVFAAGRDSPRFVELYSEKVRPNKTLVTAICAAITHNRPQPVEVLFRGCIDINGQVNGRTPLSIAAEVGNPQIMSQLLRRFPTVGEDHSLWYAVRNKHLECAEMLLEAGESPEPEHVSQAIWGHDKPLLRLVLSYGVAVDMSLLKEALDAEEPQLLRILAASFTHTTALKIALLAKDGQMVQMLLDTLSDTELQINHVGGGGGGGGGFRGGGFGGGGAGAGGTDTALSLAIQWQNVAVVRALLARGANVPVQPNQRGGGPQPQDTRAGRKIAGLLSGASLQVVPHVLVAGM